MMWPACPHCGAMALTASRVLDPATVTTATTRDGKEIITGGVVLNTGYTCPQWHYWRVEA